MRINNKAELLEFIKNKSLKFLTENQAFASLEEKLRNVDEHFVQVSEKQLERLHSEEEKAMSTENYSELQRIKKDKVTVLGKLIVSYKKKTEILEDIRNGIKQEMDSIGSQGSAVFKNKELKEFKNETLKKGDTIKISTLSSNTIVEKISENNQFKVISTTVSAIEPGDILVVPDLTIGHSAKIRIYRKDDGGTFNELGGTTLSTIKAITKNPA